MRKTLITAIALIAVHAMTEVWHIVHAIWPDSELRNVNWFVDRSAMPKGIPLLWWVKMLTDEALLCYVFFDYAYTALKTSRKKFAVVFTFFVYHSFDGAMYLYNYKQSHWFYLVLLVIDCVALVILFLPIKEKAKVIEME